MKINFSKESVLYVPDFEYNKTYLEDMEKFANDRLKCRGYLFVNDVLDMLGIKPIKRGQLDGWVWDDLDPLMQSKVKFRIKIENGEIILNLNEEKDILNYVFN